LISLERITAYAELPQEDVMVKPGDTEYAALRRRWPAKGEIIFENVTMRYRDGLPTVLNGISLTIPGGTSVGVVGRTGSGKSSMFQALFRMYELESGRVTIDGVDAVSLGIHTLRNALSVIPQDPVGFSGSLRFNLDPFNTADDTKIWKVLEKVRMREFFESKEEKLEFNLTAGGENLSVGQRQLVCAARAFMRDFKIMILDEATASVDFKTDALIQEVLSDEVKDKGATIVTIAHRINTVINADNILVMDAGRVAEFKPPKELLKDEKSKFYALVQDSGLNTEES